MSMIERGLSRTETLAAKEPSPMMAGYHIRGALDHETIRRAANILASEYPGLRARTVRRMGEVRLRATDVNRVPLVFRRDDGDPLHYEINRPWRSDQGVARIVLHERDSGQATVTLGIDHAFADGRAVLSLLGKLLGYYTELSRGHRPAPSIGNAFALPIEQLLANRFTELDLESTAELAELVAARLRGATLPVRETAATESIGVLAITFEREVTARLITLGRRLGVTVHSLLTSLLLIAIRSQLPDLTGPVPMLALHAVDLRSRLVPPVRLDTLADYTSGTVTVTPVEVNTTPAAIGEQIAEQLRTALGSPELFKQPLVENPFSVSLDMPAAFMLSNAGLVEPPELPDGLEFTGLRLLTALSLGPIPYIFATTSAGRLTLDLVYRQTLHPAHQMISLRDAVVATITSLADHAVRT